MEAVKMTYFDEDCMKVTCPSCGNDDPETLYALRGFEHEDIKLPFALMCGKCCHLDVIEADEDDYNDNNWWE